MTTTAAFTEDAYNTAVAAAIDVVRTRYPNLDLRAGTALRSLVIEPAALLDASQRTAVNRLRDAMSLPAMARQGGANREDAAAVLSNFGITLGPGAKSKGLIRINTTSPSDIAVRAGIVFTSASGARFIVTSTTLASSNPAVGESRIIPATGGRYYFTVPAEAAEVGSSGNIPQGHALTTDVILGGYVSAEAFSGFTDGEDGESLASAMARIPSALACRAMTNSVSARARLVDALPDPSVLRAVSCVGMGRREQLRDKHNVFGIAVGGRIDTYVRLFSAPRVVSFVADGTLLTGAEYAGNGVYSIQIPDYPGFYAVKHVGTADSPDKQGSLQYELVREAVGYSGIGHDFDFRDGWHEAAWSKYQLGRILVKGVTVGGNYITNAYGSPQPPVESTMATAATMPFKVDLYWCDGISALQDFVDSPETRNVAADHVVRSPAICLVGVHAEVRLKPGVAVSREELESAVTEYVNSRSFVDKLTRSEIANVLIQRGVESVDLSSAGMQLSGRVCGADGKWYYLEGDALDVSAVGPDTAMLGKGTVVFAAEPESVQVTIA